MPGKKLVSATDGLTEFAGSITDADLNLYVVDESDQTLDADGSGYRMLIHKNLAVTDGVNPVQIINGGTIDLQGETLVVTPGTGGELVTTDGEQVLTNKTLAMVQGEPGPEIHIRSSDFWIYRGDTSPNNGRARFGGGYLDNSTDHLYFFPNNTGTSTLVDHETSQNISNKTLDTTNEVHLIDDNFTIEENGSIVQFELLSNDFPVGTTTVVLRNIEDFAGSVGDRMHVQDSEFILYDGSLDLAGINTGRRARFEIEGSGDELVIYRLPDPSDTDGTLVITNTAQTLSSKTLDSSNVIANATIRLKSGANPNPTTEGDIQWETDTNQIHVGSGSSTLVFSHDGNFYTRSNLYTKTNMQTSGQAQLHWNNVTNKPSTYAPSSHNHDDRYLTQSEIATPGQCEIAYGNLSGGPLMQQNFIWNGSNVSMGATANLTLPADCQWWAASWYGVVGGTYNASGSFVWTRWGSNRTIKMWDSNANIMTFTYSPSTRVLSVQANQTLSNFSLAINQMRFLAE